MSKPKLLDLFCGAGEFSNFGFKFTNAEQESFHISMVEAVMLRLAIEFKVLKTIVVLNSVHVVNFLSLFKTTTNMLCHNKSVFVNIAILPRHWKVGAIWREFHFHISQLSNLPATLPIPMPLARLVAFLGSYLASTRCASFGLGPAFPKKLPTFLPTTYTGVPNIEVMVIKSYLSSLYSISNPHNLSIAYDGVNSNG